MVLTSTITEVGCLRFCPLWITEREREERERRKWILSRAMILN
jgi:hypothetical protein